MFLDEVVNYILVEERHPGQELGGQLVLGTHYTPDKQNRLQTRVLLELVVGESELLLELGDLLLVVFGN